MIKSFGYNTFHMKKHLRSLNLMPFIMALFLIFFNAAPVSAQDYTIYFKSGNYIPESSAVNLFADKQAYAGSLQNRKYYVLIQFYNLPGNSVNKILKDNDITLFDYIPSNTYYASIPENINSEILNGLQIRAILPVQIKFKSDTAFQAGNFPDWAKKEPGKVDIMVKYFDNIGYLESENMVKVPGAEILGHSTIFHYITLRIDIKSLAALSSQPGVIWIEPTAPPHTGFNSTGRPLHRANVLQSSLKSQRHLSGQGINASICDEGDISIHIDLRARLHHLYSGLALHSTHCSGTIAGAGLRDPNGEGMAPKAQLYSWSFNGYVIDTLDKYASKYNISLSSNSFGYSPGYYGAYDNEAYDVDYEVFFNHSNLSQIWAAANDGPSYSTISSGGNSAKDNIVVGALYQDSITVFSSSGPVNDGRIKPEVCALGGSVYSTSYRNDYTFMSGTSMATPGTTGTLALIYQRYRQLHAGKDPSARLIKAVVANSAYDMGNPGPDYKYGFGRLDALMAVRALEKNNYVEDSVYTGDTVVKMITIPKNLAQIKLLVNWDDYPGALSATREEVNNLDFRLVASKTTTYLPWKLNSGSPASNATRGIDSINVIKQITVDTLRAGTYKAMVIGKYIPKGPQHFALTWELDTNSIEVTHPMGGESFSRIRPYINDTSVNYYAVPFPGDTNFVDTNQINIGWEASGTNSVFNIYFSGDSGSSWKKVGTAASNHRDFYWTIPDTVTTAGLIKVTSGSYSAISDSTFTILQSPTILSTKSCTTRAQIVWSSSRKATSYQIMRLQGDTVWKILATQPDTTFLDSTVKANTQYWYTVRALRHNALSPRAMAKMITATGGNCFAVYDAGISAIDSPSGGFCNTNQNIYVHLNNYGAKALTSATINWTINGTAQTAFKWKGSIGSGGALSVKIGNTTFSNGSTYDIKAWTTLPNGTSDQYHGNDTFNEANIKQAMSGIYTINASGSGGSNFTTFNNAVKALMKNGLCGPIVFNVANGAYTEQLALHKIPGSSAINTITFQSQSGDSSKVFLQDPVSSVSGGLAVLDFDGAQWVTFKQITVRITGSASNSYGCVVEIDSNSDNNTITNCRLMGLKNPTGSSTHYILFSYHTSDTGNVISNNSMKYGNYGIFWESQATSDTGNTIQNNVLDSFYGSQPVIMWYHTRLIFSGNSIINQQSLSQQYSYFYGCNWSRFTGNKFILNEATSSSYGGLYIEECNGLNSTHPTLFANNFIATNGSTALLDAVYFYYNSYINIYFNNINCTNSAKVSYALTHFDAAASSTDNIENNSVVNTTGGDAMYIYSTAVKTLDYNNWYVPSTTTDIGSWSGTAYTTLAKWQSGTGFDKHSVSIDPKYFSATDLHVKNTSLIGAGLKISGITTDIDGQTRANPPCIGADEIFLTSQDAGVASVDTPSLSFCAGVSRVTVTIENFVATTLTGATVNWEVDGNTQAAYKWTGSLNQNAKKSGIYLGTYNFASGNHTLKSWTTVPNGGIDANNTNDTSTINITVNPLPAANAGANQSICIGSGVSIGAANVAGSQYSWASKPSGYSNTKSNPTVAPTENTTYYLTETTKATSCYKTDSATVIVNTLPAANAGSSQAICSGGSASIGAKSVSGDTYSWASNPSGYSSTNSNPSVTPTVTTTYYLTEKITATNCTNTDSVTITVNPLPAANAGSGQTICLSGSTSIGAKAVSGDIYSWSSSPSGYSSTLSNPSVNPTITTTYYLQETISATNCAKSDSVIVTVNPAPKANTGGNQAVCSGSSITLGGAPVVGNTYTWMSKPSGFSSTLSNPSVSPTVLTTYYLTEKAGTACTKTDSAIITVNPLPAANAGSSQAICSGSSASIGAKAVSGDTYVWASNPSGYYSTISNPSISPTITTTYYLTDTIKVTNCSKSDSVVVTVNPLPAANAGISQAICSGSSASIGGKAVSGDTYTWASNPSGYSSTIANPSVSPTINTTYYLKEKVTATNCANSDSVIITVNPLPAANAGSSQYICSGSTASIGSKAVNGDTYTWASSPSGYSSTSANPSVTPTITTTYYLTEKITANNCTNTDSVILTVNPLPKANAGSSQAVCLGSSVSLGAAGMSGNSYFWTSNPANGIFADTVSDPSVSPVVTTTYYLTETVQATKCLKSDSVIVTINPLPAANTGANQTICVGNQVNLGTASVNGNTYSWTSSSGFTSSASNPSVSPTLTTTYYLKEIIKATSCSKTDSVVVTVNPTPQAYTGNSQTICAGTAISLGRIEVAGNTYKWTSNPASSGYADTVSNPSVIPTLTTTYYLTEKAGSSCSKSDSVVILVNPAPLANAGNNGAVCLGNADSIGAAAVQGDSYSWTSNPAGYTSTLSYASVAPTATTTYILSETIVLSNCSKTDSVVVTVNPLPVVSFTTSTSGDTVFCTPNNLTYSTYFWVFGDSLSKPGSADTSTMAKPFHVYTRDGNYKINLSVTDNNGCAGSDTGNAVINNNYTSIVSKIISETGLKLIPNPFKNNVVVEYSLSENSQVRAGIYDAMGREIAELYNGNQGAGSYQLPFDADKYNAAAGVYFLRMVINDNMVNMKMVKVN